MHHGGIQIDEIIWFLFFEYVREHGKEDTIKMMEHYGFDKDRINDLFWTG